MGLLDHLALATDFSEPSEIAARACFALAKLGGARQVTLVHAERRVVLPREDVPLRSKLEGLEGQIAEAARAQLASLAARCGCEGVRIDERVVFGRPRDAIAEAAAEVGATLLALGTHQRTGLRRIVYGSIAEQIVERTLVPALVFHADPEAPDPTDMIQKLERVVVGVDRINAGPQVETAATLLECLGKKGATIVLVHALISPHRLGKMELEGAAAELAELQQGLRSGVEAQLQGLSEPLRARGHRVELRILEGEAAETILEQSRSAGLIVVGTHGLGGAPRWGLGTTTQAVLRAADVSVLVVPNRPSEEAA